MDQFVFWKVTCGDILQLFSLGITIWIGIIVQRNLTKKRYLKDFFIGEIKNIREDYKLIFNDMLTNSLSSREIINRFKSLSGRIRTIDETLKQHDHCDSTGLRDAYFEFQQYITGLDDLNSQYKNKHVTFTEVARSKMFEYQGTIIAAIMQKVIEVNNCNE